MQAQVVVENQVSVSYLELLDSITPVNYLSVNWQEVEESLRGVDYQDYIYPELEVDPAFDWGEAYAI